jgi:hypothetical protein
VNRRSIGKLTFLLPILLTAFAKAMAQTPQPMAHGPPPNPLRPALGPVNQAENFNFLRAGYASARDASDEKRATAEYKASGGGLC